MHGTARLARAYAKHSSVKACFPTSGSCTRQEAWMHLLGATRLELRREACPSALIAILAHASASLSASWWFNAIPRCSQTTGSFADGSFHVFRAMLTVQRNLYRGRWTPARSQHARSTRESNDALCATRKSALSSSRRSSGQSSPKDGLSRTSSQVSPWMYVKTNFFLGGRMSRWYRSTMRSSLTCTTPTEQALSAR